MKGILDQLRDCIDNSDTSRYAIAKATGVTQPQLSRFMHRRGGLTHESVEKIADFLGLEVVIQPRSRRKRGSK